MIDRPRYQLRANSVALSRFQWWTVGLAMLLAVVGILLALIRSTPLGAVLSSLSTMIGLFVLVSAAGRGPSK